LTKAKERDSGKAKQKPTKQKAAGAMGGYLEFCAMLELPVVDVESLKSFATYKSHDEEYEVEKNGENYILEGAGISIRSVFQIFEALRYGTTMMTDNNEATAKESFTRRQWVRIGSHYATLRDLRAVLFDADNWRAIKGHVQGSKNQQGEDGVKDDAKIKLFHHAEMLSVCQDDLDTYALLGDEVFGLPATKGPESLRQTYYPRCPTAGEQQRGNQMLR
jgi:hypothetical protein